MDDWRYEMNNPQKMTEPVRLNWFQEIAPTYSQIGVRVPAFLHQINSRVFI